jgi:tungstate transport system permease protein
MNWWEATGDALRLLASGDRELWITIVTSLKVSLTAILVAAPFSIPAGYFLLTGRFRGRQTLIVLVQTLLSFPTVVVGLLLYLLLSRAGPLGNLHWLFSQKAMILGQIVIAIPMLTAFTHAAVQGVDQAVREAAASLGAGRWRLMVTTLRAARFGIVAALSAAFGRIVSEVGCALMVGGNIAGFTRTIPTAIALETSKGEFAQGIALGLVLLVLAFCVNAALSVMQATSRRA